MALLMLGLHIEFRDSVDARVRAAMSEFDVRLAKAEVTAADARTKAMIVEREHLEEKARGH